MSQTLVTIRRKLASMKALFLPDCPRRRAMFLVIVCICMMIFLASHLHNVQHVSTQLRPKDLMNRRHAASVDSFLSLRAMWPVSKLGGILFHREAIPKPNPNANRKFVVLVWKYWDIFKAQLVYNYGDPGDKEDKLLEDCSVNNCIFTGNDSLIDTVDAVIVHLQRGLVPKVKNRNQTQRWIFLSDESPESTFSIAEEPPALDSLYNIFNWSMNYRCDADVPVPYGRTLTLEQPVNLEFKSLQDIAKMVPNWKKKKLGRIAAVIMSNCAETPRNEFLKKLRKHVDVDVYGGCSDKEEFKNRCPGHSAADCDVVDEYLFYLVLENSRCFQYLTEKVFHFAYSKGAVPVILGPTKADVESLLPPNSYLHADSETNIELLAKDINTLAANSELLLSMHKWRNHFKIVNEHGYFGTKSYHLCRVCEALNYNDDKEKIYDKELFDSFLDSSKTCYTYV